MSKVSKTIVNIEYEMGGDADPPIFTDTLSLKSLYGLLSVCYKTTLTTGGVGVAGTCPPTSKLGPFL